MKKYYVDSLSGERLGPASIQEIGVWIKDGIVHEAAPVADGLGVVVGWGRHFVDQGTLPGAEAPRTPPVTPAIVARPPSVAPPIASPFGDQYVANSRAISPILDVNSGHDLRSIGFWQKQMLSMFAWQLGLEVPAVCRAAISISGPSFLLGTFDMLIALAQLVTGILFLRAVFQLAKVLGKPQPILYLLAVFVPCLGLVAIIQLNMHANGVFRSGGVTTGFWGADIRTLP